MNANRECIQLVKGTLNANHCFGFLGKQESEYYLE